MLSFTFKWINKEYNVICRSKHYMLTIRTKLHLSHFRGIVTILKLKYWERTFFVVLCVKQMNLLYRSILDSTRFSVKTSKDHSSVIKAASPWFCNSYFAYFLFIFPYSCCVVFRLAYKCTICWIQINWGYGVSVSNKRTQNYVIVERPIHNSVVIIAFGGCKNTFIVMCKFN